MTCIHNKKPVDFFNISLQSINEEKFKKKKEKEAAVCSVFTLNFTEAHT